MPKLTPEDRVPGAGVERLQPSQLDVLESQLDRQEDSMAARVSASSTRSAVLIGASAVLAGAELASSSWSAWFTGGALALYLVAAVLGLASARSKVGREPLLPDIVSEYAEFATVSLRRELVLARMRSHAVAVHNMAGRHRLLVLGFWALALAWVLAATGTAWGLLEDAPSTVQEIRIVE
jgi:hypothetical protein